MGRKYRLQPDARLCEESDRRQTRIPAPLPAEIARVRVAHRAPIIGIDVGEDFLDLAALEPLTGRLSYARIDLRAAPVRDPITWLAFELSGRAPMPGGSAIAVVDSPALPRSHDGRERAIDSGLRAMVARLNETLTRANRIVLAMFPTPTLETFAEFAAARDCKPHLGNFARALFGGRVESDWKAALSTGGDARRNLGGRIFTRFMLAGFATHRALESLGVDTFEGYPYLAFCLWKRPGVRLPPKRQSGAVAARRKILEQMTSRAGFRISTPPSSIDLVDAAALAMSAAAARATRSTWSISHPAEGRLLVALPQSLAKLAAPREFLRGGRRSA